MKTSVEFAVELAKWVNENSHDVGEDEVFHFEESSDRHGRIRENFSAFAALIAAREEEVRSAALGGMNTMQVRVARFNSLVDTPRGDTPEIRAAELRARLIEEEAKETCDAIRTGDLVEAIDGLCDLLYVAFGAADAFGIDLEPFFDEVHRTNLEKLSGPRDEHGKILKPPGWKPPQIRKMLEALTQPRPPCE